MRLRSMSDAATTRAREARSSSAWRWRSPSEACNAEVSSTLSLRSAARSRRPRIISLKPVVSTPSSSSLVTGTGCSRSPAAARAVALVNVRTGPTTESVTARMRTGVNVSAVRTAITTAPSNRDVGLCPMLPIAWLTSTANEVVTASASSTFCRIRPRAYRTPPAGRTTRAASSTMGRSMASPTKNMYAAVTAIPSCVKTQATAGPLDDLTDRERECLALMAEGRSNAGICERTFLSPRTVESHVRTIFRKLGLDEAHDDHRRVLAALAYLRG